METKKNKRREFLKNAGSIGLFCALGTAGLLQCENRKERDYNYPPLLKKAPDGSLLKAGLIGCGYRGTGAALNFLNAGSNLQITALGDVFKDRVEMCNSQLKERKDIEVPEEKCFVGFDAFEKVIDSGVDVVILATPPNFRPEHLAACVKAGKHVFIEKPIAVDPVGVRSVMISGERAEAMGLSIVTGTIKRHQKDYIETFRQVVKGEIGDIVSANSYYNVGKLWHKNPRAEWSEMEAMIRDWVNWCWLSGDHIVEQNVHNLDTVNWFVGKHPVKAVGFGSRQRRLTGNQYDMFGVDFLYDNDVHYHSMCRQINGCQNNVSDLIRGSEGYTNCQNTIYRNDSSVKWIFDYGNEDQELDISPFDQEHVDWVTAIRTGKPVNETQAIAESTMTGIMGRVSAYTGKEVTWEEMMNSDLYLSPKHYHFGQVDVDKAVPIPGL
ncbi:Gfo/Idh/MocA family oxidoreductase [Ancylomarina sp. DW003]|nr:Gfo/Idh/MocA family oxidoreductase [Ancylomarina sp. DW003]MDE5422145.1 Gfo/Idh/MocA family oxidoreductase [Ancylomarina sp. DW003]